MKKVMLLLAAFAMFFAACGGGASTPEEVAEKYVKASLKSDYGAAKGLATEKHKAELEIDEAEWKGKEIPAEKKDFMDKMKAMVPKAEEAKISEDGNTAYVKVNLLNSKGERENMTLKYTLKKENDKWKVDAQGK